MAEWFSGDVSANGITIHYYRTGGGRPPLVLSHGSTDDGLCWTRVARALEGNYDAIMPDARGHGLSEAPETGYSAQNRAADLAGLIRALGLEQAAIGGHSMGASTALYAAAAYPELVRCAILEDPPFRAAGGEPTAAERAERAARMRREVTEQRAMSRDDLMAWLRARNPAWADEEVEPWADAHLRVSLAYAGAPHQTDRPDWREAVQVLRCPTLLLTGDPEKGALVTPEVAQEAARLQPLLRVAHIAGAGHNIRRDRFEPYMQAVRAFLSSPLGIAQ
jgi:pimeloyl-ACP methyl ester carboxylesterase